MSSVSSGGGASAARNTSATTAASAASAANNTPNASPAVGAPPVQPSGRDSSSTPIQLNGLAGQTIQTLVPGAGQINNSASGAGTARNNGNGYSRGKIDVSAKAAPNQAGFLVTVDSFHSTQNDKLTLTLQARVQDGAKEGVVTLAVLAKDEDINGQNYTGRRTYLVRYADVNAYLRKLNPNLKLESGAQLAVFARWSNGHQWGGFARAGSFYVPNPGGGSVSLVGGSNGGSMGAALPLDLSAKMPKTLTDRYRNVLQPGGSVTTRLESEYKATVSEAALERAVVEMYKMSADPQLAARAFGAGWVVEPVTRYWVKDGNGRVTESARLAKYKQQDPALANVTMGEPDPMVDQYKDTANKDLLKQQAVIRVRSNAQKAGVLNVKPGGGRIDRSTGIRQRIEVGVDLAPGANDSGVGRYLQNDTSYFNVAKQELEAVLGANVSLSSAFQPVLELNAERHRFTIKNNDRNSPAYGVEVEWTGDITKGKSLRSGDQQNGQAREATIFGFEAELNHLQLNSANQVSYTAPTSITGFDSDQKQEQWAAGLSANATTAAAPRFHSSDDLNNAAFRQTTSYRAFEGVLSTLKSHLFNGRVTVGQQKGHALAKAMGII